MVKEFFIIYSTSDDQFMAGTLNNVHYTDEPYLYNKLNATKAIIGLSNYCMEGLRIVAVNGGRDTVRYNDAMTVDQFLENNDCLVI